MLNPFFLQGSQTEQNLVQDLINEQLRMYGVEIYYIPRKYLTEKTVIREVIESSFDEAHPIEAYIENYEGYGDNTTILSKFGIQATNEITLTISRDRFNTYIKPLTRNKDNIKLGTRPKEGDLVYFPLGDRLFEIKFVEHEQPFYQLQTTYVYTLKCELFRYENEVIDTNIEEIDDVLTGTLSGSLSGYGDDSDYGGGGISAMTRILSMVGSGQTATAEVSYISDGGIRSIIVSNRGGGYTYPPIVAISSAPTGGITGIASATLISGIVVCENNVNPISKSIQSVELINPGAGYTLAPGIRFIGDGVGAAATATIGDGIIGIVSITSPGSGYNSQNLPSVIFTGSSTVSAAATVIVSSAGTISQVRITNAGLGYTQPPAVTISSPNLTGIGTYGKNEIVTGQISGATARVVSWASTNSKLEISSQAGSFQIGEYIVGAASSASYMLLSSTYAEDGFTSNNEIETEADNIIDFSEINPFGMP
jgi:hypothetical protein